MSEPIANVDMANAWDGAEGDQWTQFADEYDSNFRSIWDRFLETDRSGAGLDPELLDQRAAQLLKHPECVGLPAGAIQRDHALTPQPFA